MEELNLNAREKQAGIFSKLFIFIPLFLFSMLYLFTCTDTFMSNKAIREKYVERANENLQGATRQTNNYSKDLDENRLYGAREYYRSAIENWQKAMGYSEGDQKFIDEMKSHIRSYWNDAYDSPVPDFY